jgi:DNA-binding NtrC family response regulator
MSTGPFCEAGHVVEDEALASGLSTAVLISAATAAAVEAIAYRIHQGSSRASRPFISVNAADFPSEENLLGTACLRLFNAAHGGTVFLNNVERMSSPMQQQFTVLLDAFELGRSANDALRLVSGTTVWLFERVCAGTFSEALSYRLNVLHLQSPLIGQSIREH